MHVYPERDLRAHVTNGDPCPCLPRMLDDGAVIVHNSYDARETGETCRDALNRLGVALAEHRHTWTNEERMAYEHAMAILDMHWPARAEEPA